MRLATRPPRDNNSNVKTSEETIGDKTRVTRAAPEPTTGVGDGPAPSSKSSHGKTSLGERVQSLRLPDRANGRSSSAKLAWFLCLVLAGTTGYLAWRQYGRPQSENADSAAAANNAPDRPKPAATRQTALESELALESKGYITPTHRILVSPKVSGIVVELNIEEGQRVAKDAILARIEDTDYQTDYDRAVATHRLAEERLGELETGNRPEEISQAKAELEEAVILAEKYAADLQRATDLHRRRAISDGEFQDFQSKHDAQRRRVEKLKYAFELMDEGPRAERIRAAQAEVRQAQAEVAKAKWRLDNCIVRAPISGTILTKEAEEGNLVNPIAFSGSRSLCEMADLSSLEVDLSIVERDIAKVFKGQKCVVKAEAYPDREYRGVVSRLMPIADRAKGAVSVRVLLTVPPEEEGVYLKPEMSARVTFLKDAAAANNGSASGRATNGER